MSMVEEVTEIMDIEVAPNVTATVEVTYPLEMEDKLDMIKEKIREGLKKLANKIGGVPYEGLYARVFPDHIVVWWERAGATYAEARVPFKGEVAKAMGMWERRIKNLLVKVTLYQYGKYSAEKLDKELTEFLRDAEKELCKAIRRNGGVCYKEAFEEMTPKEAEDYVEDQIRNFETLGRTGKIIADLLRLSLEFRDLDKMGLRDKILLFDKIVHAEHAVGAFKEYLAEEKSIFGVNIIRIKGEADKEVEEILKGKEKAPDPQEDRDLFIQAAIEAFRKFR